VDHRIPLKFHTVLAFEGISCHVEEVIGQGSNAIVYKGWYRDGLNKDLCHHVLIKELFPFHPRKKIWREDSGRIVVEPEAEDLWNTHKESFVAGNEVHLRLLSDQPDLMAMGANLNSYQYNGTLYSVLGYTGGRSLQAELNKTGTSLRHTAQRMIGLLDALEAFHKSGYLHLDISPDNIMLVGREDQERPFLIDYNSARKIESRDNNFLSCKAGFSAPEVSTGNQQAICFASDLYSVAAVFYRCLMGRTLTLAEALQPKAPDGQDSPMLKDMPQTVISMVSTILKKGLHTLPRRRYQSIGQMRQVFQELLDRIDCVGVTHWSLWENGKRSVEELIRINPSLRYLKGENKLYPIRLEGECSVPLESYLEHVAAPEGKSGLILAQGGMGKTTLLLHTAMLRSKRYSPAAPAVFYISLNGWNKGDTHYIRNQILMRLRFKREENTFGSAMHALHQLMGQTLKTKNAEVPTLLLLLDGLNEVRGDVESLVQEIHELKAMAGVRIIAASRSALPELHLETVKLMALDVEDIEEALGRSGLLIPNNPEILQLLRTPLVLSIYIDASEGGRQLDVQNEEELMAAYMSALLEKEIRQLPEDSPQRWQIDVALNYVLPAIAAEIRKTGTTLSEQQLLTVVNQCWGTLTSGPFRKAFPQWIGRSADIRADAKTAEEWYGIVIHGLLWQRLGMLMKDNAGRYGLFHQAVGEYLADCRIPIVNRKKWIGLLAAVLLCGIALAGYQQHRIEQMALEQQIQAEDEIKAVLELGTGGYAEYGNLYRQLRELVDYARGGETEAFFTYYARVLTALQEEQKKTASEETEARQVERTSVHDQLHVTWGDQDAAYEYEILADLLSYPEDRANMYADIMPLLKTWVEADTIRGKTPAFADSLSALLEADAALAAEMYHRAVGVHLSGTDTLWLENINALIALIPEQDSHRDTAIREDRGQMLNSLSSAFLRAKSDFDAEYSKLNAYVRNNAK